MSEAVFKLQEHMEGAPCHGSPRASPTDRPKIEWIPETHGRGGIWPQRSPSMFHMALEGVHLL